MKSLQALKSILADAGQQVDILEHQHLFPLFSKRLENVRIVSLDHAGFAIFQVNVGKMCNQVCKHCHVDAGPDRKEIMTRETMQQCMDVLGK